ncbi:MAG TPA: phytoene desaturase family protein [Bacteroidales bacterium]|nr:phytoene desaturase family protein [Bacteroidales bacterium]
MTKTACIIGSGIGGMAVAIRLAAKGYKVKVFEKNDMPGGRISQAEENGFRFDTGPTKLYMPEMLDELFVLHNKNPRNYFNYHRAESSGLYFFPDGTQINAWCNAEKLADEISNKTSVPKHKVYQYLHKCQKLWELASPLFLYSPLYLCKNFLKAPCRKALLQFYRLDIFTSLDKRNRKLFLDSKVVEIFNSAASSFGNNPYKSVATIKYVSHLNYNLGVYHVQNGMYSIVKALYDLAIEAGVTFYFDSPITRVFQSNKRIVSINTATNAYFADLLVIDTDVVHFYRDLMQDKKMAKKAMKKKLTSSAIIFYWGLSKKIEGLNFYNIIVSGDSKKQFDTLFKNKAIDSDPSIYINDISGLSGNNNPEGYQYLQVMVSVPAKHGHNWKKVTEEIKNIVLSKIEKTFGENISKNILFEQVATPLTYTNIYNTHNGSLFGQAINSFRSFFTKHPNFISRETENLYFTGSSVHPGGGIHHCLASAKIIATEAN